jgi:hypothetical protein
MTETVPSAPDADEFRLDGYVALVTGAGRGIGAGIAQAYAQAGADLVLVARTATDLDAVAASVRALGRTALAIPTDVTDVSQLAKIENGPPHRPGHADLRNGQGRLHPAHPPAGGGARARRPGERDRPRRRGDRRPERGAHRRTARADRRGHPAAPAGHDRRRRQHRQVARLTRRQLHHRQNHREAPVFPNTTPDLRPANKHQE